MKSDDIRYCVRCSTALIDAVRYGRSRRVCPACDWVYFADPKVAAAVLVEQDGKVLMVRRAVDPGRGLWTLPAGFVDAGEDPARAAERECLEETGLHVQAKELLTVLFGQEHERGAHIILFYRGVLSGGVLSPDDDVDEVGFFSRAELPELAFKTTRSVLEI